MRWLWSVLALWACAAPVAPSAGRPVREGRYALAGIQYVMWCYEPDTVRLAAPPFVENAIRFQMTPGDSVRGLFDASSGRITVVFRIGVLPDTVIIAVGPDEGAYRIAGDSLRLTMARIRWLNVPTFVRIADTLRGAAAADCETLDVTLVRMP